MKCEEILTLPIASTCLLINWVTSSEFPIGVSYNAIDTIQTYSLYTDIDSIISGKSTINNWFESNIDIELAATEHIWDGQYDGSYDKEYSAFYIPRAEMMVRLHLHNSIYDGFIEDETGRLAGYDTSSADSGQGFIIRKDLLDKYLSKTGKHLVWLSYAGREAILHHNISEGGYKRYSALFIYNSNNVDGEFYEVGF